MSIRQFKPDQQLRIGSHETSYFVFMWLWTDDLQIPPYKGGFGRIVNITRRVHEHPSVQAWSPAQNRKSHDFLFCFYVVVNWRYPVFASKYKWGLSYEGYPHFLFCATCNVYFSTDSKSCVHLAMIISGAYCARFATAFLRITSRSSSLIAAMRNSVSAYSSSSNGSPMIKPLTPDGERISLMPAVHSKAMSIHPWACPSVRHRGQPSCCDVRQTIEALR